MNHCDINDFCDITKLSKLSKFPKLVVYPTHNMVYVFITKAYLYLSIHSSRTHMIYKHYHSVNDQYLVN